ncbi:MAG: eukaryotic-like serine/threonine-protein kinase, partial [Thermoleophilaceae bacterium]|nr:eukaryotic-like serine/threonine-protein kinase [Thermoleophilaceae bacterium]
STSATKALESRGFTVALSESNSDRPQGEVLAQSLAPGTQVDEGSEVRLTISKGQPKVQIPDLTGLSKATATAALKKRGLKVDVQEVDTTDPTQVGKVIDQSPGPNSDATKGDPVTIKIGKAPADSSNGGSTTPAPPTPPGQ